RSVALADDEAGRRARDALISRADVLITTDGPQGLAKLGLDLAALVDQLPQLIAVSVTPYGLTGPYAQCRASDLVALAGGGLLNSCGYDDHSIPPIRPGGNPGYMVAASFALFGPLSALGYE